MTKTTRVGTPTPHGVYRYPSKHTLEEEKSVSPDPPLTNAKLEGDLPGLERLARVPVSLHDGGVRLPGAAAGRPLESTLAHKRSRDGLR